LSDEQEARYKVTFFGPVHNDIANVNRLVEGLKDRFKLSDEAVTKMMRMAPVAIKSGATLSEAQRYQAVLEAMGAKVQVEPIEEVPEELQQPEKSPSPPQGPEAPQGEEPQQTTEKNASPLDREPQVIPVKAKTPSLSATSAESSGMKTEAGPQMVKCPQCGYVQEQTDECIKCGIIISKFLKYQGEVKPPGVEAPPPGTIGAPAEGPQAQRIIGTPMEEPTGYSPWEDMATLGFFKAFFRTIKEVLFSPPQFFRAMPVDKNIHYSLLYGIIMGFFVALSGLLWQFAFSGLTGGGKGMQGMEALFTPFFLIIYAFFLPFVIIFSLFMYTGMLHTMLILVGGNRRGLDATFRVVAYTQSAQIFTLIPILGVFIYLIYTPILLAIGFKESHQINTGKAVFAVLLPAIIVLAVGIIVAVMFVPLILSLIPQMMMPQQPPGF
jgi:hypothetical protein